MSGTARGENMPATVGDLATGERVSRSPVALTVSAAERILLDARVPATRSTCSTTASHWRV